MSILLAILFGIVQGLTEFLPISSSGHLVLLQQIFGLAEPLLLFDIILHLGTLLAVCIVFKNTLWEVIKHPFSKKGKLLMLATTITLILAFIGKDFFEDAFAGSFLWISFFITGVILLFAQWTSTHTKESHSITYTNGTVMGLFQGLAILPGLSRSGLTISSAIVQGVNRKEAAEFSFLMSIPIILASFFWELLKLDTQTGSVSILPMLIGFLFATVFGFLAIKIMLKVIEQAKYYYFSIYLLFLSIFLVLNQTVLFWF